MRTRLKVLRRLAGLHDIVERTHAGVLERCVSEVRQAEHAIDRQDAAARSAACEGRAALIVDDRTGWSLAEAQWELARWRRAGLERIHAERDELRLVAQEQYVTSRIESERMHHMVESVEARAAIEDGRRIQSATDDRYLSRKIWVERQQALRDAEMNGS